jgi:DNA polymerase III, alpha chain, Gram-positive type
MDDKLKKLLEQIDLDGKNYPYFEDGILEKIVGSTDKTQYTFLINIKEILPAEVFSEFILKVKEEFLKEKIERVIAVFTPLNTNLERVQEYFDYLMDRYSKKCPALSTLVGTDVEIKSETLIIPIDNVAEENKLYSLEKEIIMDFRSFGYKIERINPILKDEPEIVIEDDVPIFVPEERLEKSEEPIVDVKTNFKKNYKPKPIETEDHPDVVLGRLIDTEPRKIESILEPTNGVTLEAELFGIEFRETKTDLVIITLKITDYTDSMYAKIFANDKETVARIKKGVKTGKWYKFRGNVKEDKYSGEDSLSIYDINVAEHIVEERKDDAKIKRVELHAHTTMSQMDGVVDAKDLVSQAKKWGHKAIAITEHNGAQSFPDVHKTIKGMNKGLAEGEEPFKPIYGLELTMVDDDIRIVIRPTKDKLMDETYIIFDFETTGFNAGGGDSIIEIGAVKLFNGEIIDRFSELINPGRKLPPKIIEITHITDEMLEGKQTEEEAMTSFKDWCEDLPMIAHNAKFDISFLEMAYQKYNLGTFENTVIDTLELSRTLDNNYSRHGLSALVKRYEVPWDENAHHRADYDAEGTALVYHKMMKKLIDRNYETIEDLNNLVAKDEIHKYGRTYHVNILSKNRAGLKNMFKILSYASTKYLYKTPRILRSILEEHREGLLIGSGCYESEVFVEARAKSDEELTNVINFYDYVEVQPPECYDHLVQAQDFGSKQELLDNIEKIIRVTKEAGKIIVATGDVHHLNREEKIYREIIVNQKVPGGGRHPLARKGDIEIPSYHFRTTDEMLEDFSFLNDKKLINEIVIDNTNELADMIEMVDVIIDTGGVPYSPKIENSVETVNKLVFDKAQLMYGDPLPELIATRIEQELNGIIKGGYDVIYLISQKLVKKSNDDGYLVGSRGSVGSSFIAFLMGITEVNALPAHYVCPNCKHTIFDDEKGNPYGKKYSSGYDLPNKECPDCSTKMSKEGQDMPFATFLGFNADKVPDIDLNFSGEYQWKAHEYTKELFGVDNVYRAGTFGTVADKTAYGFVKGYCEDKGISKRSAEIERLALGCTGVKRTTGQHPGGIVVIPEYMDVFDFTPYQFPADDPNSLWRTTHFDYHPMEEEILKLDILGHDDPTMLRMLQDLSGIDVTTLPFDDEKVLSILSSPKALGVTAEQIMCSTGTLGVPELGTKFVIQMLEDTKPNSFGGLVKISGLSHGTDVWLSNAQELIQKKVVPFEDVIGCRDDIMVYLMNEGIEPIKAFKIMEFVRKGMPSKLPDVWEEHAQTLRDGNIAEWYIESCRKIKYMFPKAHAVAYVMSALRIAWFKVHHPIWYYTAFFSIRCADFDIEAMIKGYDEIKKKILEIDGKGYEATNKEQAVADVLKIALEATARGISFAPIDLMNSDSTKFVISDENKLIPPYRTIDGLGDTVAKNIIEEREKSTFLSIEDVQRRAKVSGTLIDKMKSMGIFDGMEESNQMSLF